MKTNVLIETKQEIFEKKDLTFLGEKNNIKIYLDDYDIFYITKSFNDGSVFYFKVDDLFKAITKALVMSEIFE